MNLIDKDRLFNNIKKYQEEDWESGDWETLAEDMFDMVMDTRPVDAIPVKWLRKIADEYNSLAIRGIIDIWHEKQGGVNEKYYDDVNVD